MAFPPGFLVGGFFLMIAMGQDLKDLYFLGAA